MPRVLPASAPVAVYWHLSPPVVVVTYGRGREVFDDSRRLFARLAEIPTLGDRIAAIHAGTQHVDARSVEALTAMLETVGFAPFFRLCRESTGPESLLRSRWCWEKLADYVPVFWERT